MLRVCYIAILKSSKDWGRLETGKWLFAQDKKSCAIKDAKDLKICGPHKIFKFQEVQSSKAGKGKAR